MKSKNVEEVLILKYVSMDTVSQWIGNVKRHDLETLMKSIRKHGFRDPLSYDVNLNKGAGGIVEGNGRDLALKTMYAQNPKKPPRGITVNDKGEWMVPVLFGVDAVSQAAAESYGFDHNNITMMGGELKLPDIMSLYTDQAAVMLKNLQANDAMPVSITGEGLDALLESESEKLSEHEEEIREKTMLRILVSVPVNSALDAQAHIEALKQIPGVEVDMTGNG